MITNPIPPKTLLPPPEFDMYAKFSYSLCQLLYNEDLEHNSLIVVLKPFIVQARARLHQ